MELQFLQNEVTSFLRQRRGSTFTKPEIALGVAQHLVETQRSNERIEVLSEEILEELNHHHLRDWPKVVRTTRH